jgi:hypothetical protein
MLVAHLLLLAVPHVPQPCPHPPLTDLERFPGREVVSQQLLFCRKHLAWLEVQAQLYPHRERELAVWAIEVREALGAWEVLEQAQACYGGDPAWKRERLAQLRDLIGYPAYYAGRLPTVPLWRFRRLP